MPISVISIISNTSNASNVSGSSDHESSAAYIVGQPIAEDQSMGSQDSLVVCRSDDALSTCSENHFPEVEPRRSAKSYLNFVQDCRRRYGGMLRGQQAFNIPAQQWRSMDSEQRNQYRNRDHRRLSSEDLSDPLTDFFGLSALKARSEDCFGKSEPTCSKSKSKRKRSCKSKRKKSSCGKRRRRKSACKKSMKCQKPKKSKKSCGKRRRKPRKTC